MVVRSHYNEHTITSFLFNGDSYPFLLLHFQLQPAKLLVLTILIASMLRKYIGKEFLVMLLLYRCVHMHGC